MMVPEMSAVAARRRGARRTEWPKRTL